MTKPYYLILIILLLFSCEDSTYPGLINDCEDEVAFSEVSFVDITEVKITQPPDFDGRVPNYSYYKEGDSEYIVFCGNGQVIQFFNMSSGELDFIVEPNRKVPLINEVGNFYVQSRDSIFFFRDVPPKAFLVNGSGELIDQWDLGGAPINWGNIDEYALYKSKPGFYFKNDKFYISLNHSMFFGIKDREGLRTQGIYDYKKDKWDSVYGELPDFYETNDNIEFIGAFTHPDRVFNDDKTIISYPQSHEIHVYDRQGNLKGTYCASSQYVKKLDEPILKKDADDRQKGFMRFSSAPAYLGFYYHKELNVYTRLVRHKFDIDDGSGGLRSPCKIEYSLIVLDAEFKKIGESKLDGLLYDWRFAQATDSGFWLMPICDIWPGEEVMNYTTHVSIQLNESN